ncbi:MAG: Panacea domain-containing protein [Sneathiella sp.]
MVYEKTGPRGFNPRKAAHAAAFFILKSNGTLNVLKLVKLLYLAERESMDRFDDPMFYDKFVSMDYGPVPSATRNLISGFVENEHWNECISSRTGHNVGITSKDVTLDTLDELSRADEAILEDLWGKFGHFDQFKLAEYTHKNCPEWEDPKGSSTPISHELIYKFLGKENTEELSRSVSEHRTLARKLAVAY